MSPISLPRASRATSLLALFVIAALSGCVQETTLRYEISGAVTSQSDTKALKCKDEATLEVEYRIDEGDFIVIVQDGNGTVVFSKPYGSGSGDEIIDVEGKSGTWQMTVSLDAFEGLADVHLKC